MKISRRAIVRSTAFGVLSVSIPQIAYARYIEKSKVSGLSNEKLFFRYPSIDDEIVSEVVGKSHFNLERVKELVDKRPELARATWDWGFGDWETALGAASHVGRRDIAEYLISMGARPDIFTFAMFGKYKAVKAMIDSMPGTQSIFGPHGISLLDHAKAGLRSDSLNPEEISECNKLIDWLELLGDADPTQKHIEMDEKEKEKYVGDYMYGTGESDGLSIKLNMRKLLSMGKLGNFGGALYQESPGVFRYNGIRSVSISFEEKDDKIISLTINEPDLILKAIKSS